MKYYFIGRSWKHQGRSWKHQERSWKHQESNNKNNNVDGALDPWSYYCYSFVPQPALFTPTMPHFDIMSSECFVIILIPTLTRVTRGSRGSVIYKDRH